MRDFREHRKITFHQKLLEHDWRHVNTGRNVDSPADCLHSDLHHLMELCFPAKTVRMSSRDPPRMTPLVKVLLKKKARLQARSVRGVDLEDFKAKIDKNISENRMALATGKKESRAWWRKVDVLTHRKDKDNLSLDKNFVQDFNTYFGNLCYDDNYISPTPMEIVHNASIPQLTTSQVFNTLSKIKKSATGPDGIPYWIWKEHAAILTPVVEAI